MRRVIKQLELVQGGGRTVLSTSLLSLYVALCREIGAEGYMAGK